MNSRLLPACAVLAAATLLGVTGCLNLKPAPDLTRYFLLSSVPEPAGRQPSADDGVALGIAPVTIPGYLDQLWMAVRLGSNEVHYSDYDKWGERLGQGVQRVVGANLGILLHTDRIQLTTWSRGAVELELELTVERFEVDVNGTVELVARWRIESPGTDKAPQTGHRVIRKDGPKPGGDTAGAVGTMSDALTELSRILAEAVQGARN